MGTSSALVAWIVALAFAPGAAAPGGGATSAPGAAETMPAAEEPYPVRETLRPLVLPAGTVELHVIHTVLPWGLAFQSGEGGFGVPVALLPRAILRIGIAEGVQLSLPIPEIDIGRDEFALGVGLRRFYWGYTITPTGFGGNGLVWISPDVVARWQPVVTETVSLRFAARVGWSITLADPNDYVAGRFDGGFLAFESEIASSPLERLALFVRGSVESYFWKRAEPLSRPSMLGAELGVQYTLWRFIDLYADGAVRYWTFDGRLLPRLSVGMVFRGDFW